MHAIEMNIPLNRCNCDDHTKVKITLHFCSELPVVHTFFIGVRINDARPLQKGLCPTEDLLYMHV